MTTKQRRWWISAFLLFGSCSLWAEDVRVTVFTLKDGKEVEALRFVAAERGGEVVYSITKTDGSRDLLFGSEVVGRSEKTVAVDKLPAAGRGLVEAARSAEANRAFQRIQEQEAERQRAEASRQRERDARQREAEGGSSGSPATECGTPCPASPSGFAKRLGPGVGQSSRPATARCYCGRQGICHSRICFMLP